MAYAVVSLASLSVFMGASAVSRAVDLPLARLVAGALAVLLFATLRRVVIPLHQPYATSTNGRVGAPEIISVFCMLAVSAVSIALGLWFVAPPLIYFALLLVYMKIMYRRVNRVVDAIDTQLAREEAVLADDVCRWKSTDGKGAVVVVLTNRRLIVGDTADGAARVVDHPIESIGCATFGRKPRGMTGWLDISIGDSKLRFHNVSPLNLFQLVEQLDAHGVAFEESETPESAGRELARWHSLAPFTLQHTPRRSLRERWFWVAGAALTMITTAIAPLDNFVIDSIVGEELDSVASMLALQATCFAIGYFTRTLSTIALVPFIWLGLAPLFAVVDFAHPVRLIVLTTIAGATFLLLGALVPAGVERRRRLASV